MLALEFPPTNISFRLTPSDYFLLSRFRHLVQQLYDASQLTRDWAGTVSSTLAIRVRRDHLLLDSIDLLKQVSNNRKPL